MADLTGSPDSLTLVFCFSFPGKKYSEDFDFYKTASGLSFTSANDDRARCKRKDEIWKFVDSSKVQTLTTSQHLYDCLPNDDSGKLGKKSECPE